MADLDGRVAVVTGGANGIGLGICECLSEQGATVVVADIVADAAQAAAERLPGTAMAVTTDVSSADSVAALADAVRSEHGKLDILVNNAGVGPEPTPIVAAQRGGVGPGDERQRPRRLPRQPGAGADAGRFRGRPPDQHLLDRRPVGLRARLPVRRLEVRGDRDHPVPGARAGAEGVTVNSIHPGILETELHSNVVRLFSAIQGQSEEATWDWFKERIPLGRFQTPRDVGEMAAFLASDRAKNLTGAAFNVDGGWEMH